jgi:galactokinase/mevalonate kinase-like predicted kinase
MRIVRARAFARSALLGNPSDGYGGRTISFAFTNFSAEVVVYEWPRLEILPGPSDQVSFAGLGDLVSDVEANGYYGGLRLVKAGIKRFADWCGERSIEPRGTFSIRYESTIPRGVGLGGSSAIVTAVLRGLLEFNDLEIEMHELPDLALSVETDELGITAGLQDRVAQAYQGVTHMDFGAGEYEPLDPALLPSLLIAYAPAAAQPSHDAHRAVRERFLAGDEEVRAAMSAIAELAEQGREALLEGDADRLGELMQRNLELRRAIFRLEPPHLRMAEAAAELGLPANYAGSGGAIVVIAEDRSAARELGSRLRDDRCRLVEPTIAEGVADRSER